MKVAYVTFPDPLGRDDEREIALAAWAEVGIEGTAVPWDDPAADWASFDAAVVRSTWNYIERRDDFVAWAGRVESVTRLFNPASVIEWNTDKTYLRGLGVPIVPTHWSASGFPEWDEYVVKPTVSASARDTIRTKDRGEAEAHAARLVADGPGVMVQPYIDTVEHEGELSLLYFGGQFSHAVRRRPMLGGAALNPENRTTLRDPDADQFDLAELVLGKVSEELLYARVDLVRMPDGEPVLMELELTEPYLFLRYEFDAADLFAGALAGML